jgi:dTDP-4-amino-4,6-dideoxygalactose transaminase
VRKGPGSDETATLVAGLLNLPVHTQMTEEHARRLVDFLNCA